MHGHNPLSMLHHVDARAGLAVFSVILAATMLAYPASTEQARHSMGVYVNSSAEDLSVGLSLDRDTLDFGSVPQQRLKVSKELTVENTREYPATVHLRVTGNISDYLALSKDSVHLEPGEAYTTDITLQAMGSMATGYHSGELVVYARRPLYQIVLGTAQRTG